MKPRGLSNAVRDDLRRHWRHMGAGGLGIAMSIAALSFFLALGLGVREVLLGQVFSLDRIEVFRPSKDLNLLAIKDQLGQVDSEFDTALTRSAETGPWEPRVQMQIIRSGLRHWDRLGEEKRELVRQKATDALKVQPREIFTLARDYGRPDLICGSTGVRSQIDQWCQEVL